MHPGPSARSLERGMAQLFYLDGTAAEHHVYVGGAEGQVRIIIYELGGASHLLPSQSDF